MFYLYEVDQYRTWIGGETINCIVEAPTREDANKAFSAHYNLQAEAKDWEVGEKFGCYRFPCNCDSSEECDGHSGLETSEVVQEFETFDEALRAKTFDSTLVYF